MYSIVGYPPILSSKSIEYSELRDVIDYILQKGDQTIIHSSLKAPDFSLKIEFNGLSKTPANFLNYGGYYLWVMNDYFSRNSTSHKQSLAILLRNKYVSLRDDDQLFVPDGETKADVIFFKMLEWMLPRKGKSVQDAAMVIMANYFEACDIFEDPNGSSL